MEDSLQSQKLSLVPLPLPEPCTAKAESNPGLQQNGLGIGPRVTRRSSVPR
jgi:hypothetical protein